MSGAWTDAVADWLVRTSWQAAVLVAIVLVIHATLGRQLAPRWRYAMWMIVVARLLMPALPASPWSVFNLRASMFAAGDAAVAAPPPVIVAETPRVAYGLVAAPLDSAARVTPIAARPTPATPARFEWRTYLVVAWVLGAVVVLGRATIGVAMLRRRLRGAEPASGGVLELLARCRREMSLRTAPPLLLTDAVAGPAVFGFVRPRLLVPPRLIDELTADELRFVLLHELAHVRRRDALANAALVLAQAVHWFNPVARLALSRCRAERELACDALVMSVDRNPTAATGYGRAVLRVADAFSLARRAPVAAVGMIHTRSQLRRRIAMIAAFTPARSRRRPVLPVLLLLCVASCALTDETPKASTRGGVDARPVTEAGAAPVPAEPGVDARLQAALDRRLGVVTFDDVPLDDALKTLRGQAGDINLLVDWRAFEAAGIDRTAPVSARLRDVPFSKALQVVLDHAGGDTVKLGFAADGNVLNVTTAEVLARNTVTRVYDVRDLLIEIPSVTDAPVLGRPEPVPAPAANRFPKESDEDRAKAAKAREERVEQIVTLVKETVDPQSWRDNGGTVGAVRELQGQLIVTQTAENHRQVAVLLDQLREKRSIQVMVETRLVTFDPSRLPERIREALAPPPAADDGRGGRFLSDADVETILKEAQAQKDASIVTYPRIMLFNGQRAYVMTATQHAYVSGFKAVQVEGAGEQRYEPENSIINTGEVMDVAATVSADRKHCRLTLRPQLTRLEGMETVKYVGPPGSPKDAEVQVPLVSMRKMDTTVIVPDRQTLLIASLTQGADNDAPATRPVMNQYMLVKATNLVQR